MMRSSTGMDIPATLVEWCDPARMALVVYDMQVGICRQIKDSGDVIERAAEVLDAARSANMRVAFTRHVSLPHKWMGATQLRTAITWQRKLDPDTVESPFLPDADVTQIVPQLKPRSDEAVFDKLTMSAFDSTSLGFALKDCGLRAIALIGIAVEIGIEPTARQSTDHGFTTVLIEDACGFGNAEARDRSMSTLRFIGEAIFTDVAGFRNALRAATKT
jgi:biuret amidohydrolase